MNLIKTLTGNIIFKYYYNTQNILQRLYHKLFTTLFNLQNEMFQDLNITPNQDEMCLQRTF